MREAQYVPAGFEPGECGVTLGENEPGLAVVEGKQPVVETHPPSIGDVDCIQFGRHR